MTLEAEVASLTTATTDLLAAVNVSKATLDANKNTAISKAAEAAAAAGTATAQAAAASGSATAADTSRAQAQTAQAQAQSSASSVSAALASFRALFLGAFATDALAVAFASANSITLVDGVMYENTTGTPNKFRIYNGTSWDDYDASAQVQQAAAILAATNAAAAKAAAETARDQSVTAKTASETARDQSVTAKTAAEAVNTTATQKALDASAAAVQAVQAKQDAETAKNAAVAVVTGGTASLNPAAGKIPIADADGRINAEWIRQQTNDIGVPGTLGFGVGIAPSIPAGYSVMTGTTILGHDNYGNYQYSDGSVMVWVPRCWFKYGLGVANNGLAEGNWDVKPAFAFKDETTANAAGYMSHRADWDGGLLMPGQMVDKYQVSNNGGIGSSIKNAMPVVSGPSTGQVGFSALTGAPTNQYHGAIAASKTRGAQFFPTSRFIYAKLAILSLAHAQASTNTTYAAWYGATTNFPKGNNNNNLKDANDATVTYTTAGASSYPNFALTGSGAPFNKTTHNGQNCGIADLNGNIWEISLGMTCIAVSKTITAATQANPVQITAAAHGFATGDIVMITSVVGMTQINDKMYKITVNGTDTFTLDGCDGTAFTAYTSAGSVARGKWYAAKKSVAMKDFTNGTTLATDHWGATGVTAMMDQINPEFRLDYPNNGISQRYGNGSGLVFSNAASGNDWTLTGLGIPKSTGISSGGTNAFGQDYYYQYVRDQLCVISGGSWGGGASAGVWSAALSFDRAGSGSNVGFRSASYPVAP